MEKRGKARFLIRVLTREKEGDGEVEEELRAWNRALRVSRVRVCGDFWMRNVAAAKARLRLR